MQSISSTCTKYGVSNTLDQFLGICRTLCADLLHEVGNVVSHIGA